MKQIVKLMMLGLVMLGLWACEKEPVASSSRIHVSQVLVLNEALMGSNTASISAIDADSGRIENNWFYNHNSRNLGDQAQDMILLDGKVYVTVTESNTLEAIDTATGVAVRKSMGSLKPRSMVGEGGKLYVTCYNPPCVVRMDAATLDIEDTCLLGDFKPEELVSAQGKLFVASAYHKENMYLYDDKIHVIDIATFAKLESIVGGSNNIHIKKINDNTLIVAHGNGTTSSPSGTYLINATTHEVTHLSKGLSNMTVYNGKVYGYDAPYNNGSLSFAIINADGTVEDFPFTPAFENLERNEMPYGIAVNPENGDIYLTTDGGIYRVPGDVYCFRPDGTLRFKVEAGILPSKVLFLTD